MPRHRTYRLLCPIARALDRIGDRWSLLILRDLHAGPARFGEIHRGLPGLATNLLSSRLQQLQTDGLIVRRPAEHNVVIYALTEAGERTAPVLFELAAFGARFPAPDDRRRPGNLRLIVVTLKEALRRVVAEEPVHAELIIDDEPIAIRVSNGNVDVRYAPDPDAPLSVRTDYEAMMAVGDGHMSQREFSTEHVVVERGGKRAAGALFSLIGRGLRSG